ncbi:endonuclease/exonuclease/phosphatase family protein [Pseudomonas sp. S2_A05]
MSVRPTKDFKAIAKVAKNVDFMAVQELMSENALNALTKELAKQTGVHWSSMASHAVGRSSYKEMYGFVWRADAISYEDGAVTYLDRRDTFEREPYSARFKSLRDNAFFVAATVHILYGKNQAERSTEIVALSDYWDWLHQTYPDTDQIFLMGDFNTPPAAQAWASLDKLAKPLMLKGASTLSAKDGQFANLYDNVFISKDSRMRINGAEVFNYPKYLGLNNAQGRSRVSDHAPIFLNVRLNSTTSSLQASTSSRKIANPVGSAERNPTIRPIPSQAQAMVIGNLKTKIYHMPGCPSYATVSAKNRVEFPNEKDAMARDFRRAKNCL